MLAKTTEAEKSAPSLAPKQKRSANTESQLVGAALQVLEREGLDGATVPRIAAAANLSPASLYRRFTDKDDLLRAAFLRMLRSTNEHAEKLRHSLVRTTLPDGAAALIGALLKQYRQGPQLRRALIRMLEAEPESTFAKHALQQMAENLEHFAGVLLVHRDNIRHPDPERAARFAVLSVTSAIEHALAEPVSLWRAALPLNDKAFAAELTRQTVAYLRRKA